MNGGLVWHQYCATADTQMQYNDNYAPVLVRTQETEYSLHHTSSTRHVRTRSYWRQVRNTPYRSRHFFLHLQTTQLPCFVLPLAEGTKATISSNAFVWRQRSAIKTANIRNVHDLISAELPVTVRAFPQSLYVNVGVVPWQATNASSRKPTCSYFTITPDTAPNDLFP